MVGPEQVRFFLSEIYRFLSHPFNVCGVTFSLVNVYATCGVFFIALDFIRGILGRYPVEH